MLNRHYQTNGALLVGPVVAPDDVITGETLGVIPGNRSNFVVLARTLRVTETLVTTGRMNEAESGSDVRLPPVVRRRQAFVDCLTETGWRKGSIAWPMADAVIVAAGFREEHPNWAVEINPIEGTP